MKAKNSVGPEVTIGYLFRNSIILSNSISYLRYVSNQNYQIKNRINFGSPFIGITSGPLFYVYNNKKYFGFENGIWAGIGLFGELNYKISKHKGKLSTSAKLKLPLPFELFKEN